MDQSVETEQQSDGSPAEGRGGFPWYVKVALAVVILVIVFVVGVDLLEFLT